VTPLWGASGSSFVVSAVVKRCRRGRLAPCPFATALLRCAHPCGAAYGWLSPLRSGSRTLRDSPPSQLMLNAAAEPAFEALAEGLAEVVHG
jgi:hypothetical protein